MEEIAPRVINECLKVTENEQVTIFTWDHTLDSAAALALEVERVGGISTTNLMPNEFYWSYLRGVSEAQFNRRQKGLLALLDQTDAIVQLGGPKDPSEFTRIPGERLAKMNDGQQQIVEKINERKIRSMFLPIGLVTQERARTYGFDYENWMRVFNNSINVDHAKVAALGQRLADRIERGVEVRLTASNGTDLRFKLKGRPVHIHDGMIDDDDRKRGTQFENLPAGVLEHAPDENSAEGVIQFDMPQALAGKMLRGLKWEFKNGHLTGYDATANVESFRGLYENAKGDKDRIADIAVGLNPRAEPIGFFTDRIVQGTVSIGIGLNAGIGGDNKGVFGYEGSLRRPTLEIDGAKIVTDGKIQV